MIVLVDVVLLFMLVLFASLIQAIFRSFFLSWRWPVLYVYFFLSWLFVASDFGHTLSVWCFSVINLYLTLIFFFICGIPTLTVCTWTWQHSVITHLEKPKPHVNLVFVDFSSAFNTVHAHFMRSKLCGMNANPHLILWVFSFLTGRDQRVRVDGHFTTARTITTGNSPQGSVISSLTTQMNAGAPPLG